ncbi:hypothetical protein [Fusibacillus kribbianus]|uniref:Uncharacterized protein n=1 Tax=Fusibacillus kribbianus TaxID=3044208 RepID=A0AAP4BDP7_9FIRM|nr:hypothetical protein [Ruminococcus sp. YH-rum2234]MDI9243318.1 hypothetical protein [Ruminococcus sp. YH-rum2234]
MAFGIGINSGHQEHGELKGPYQEVAVKCWFTASGRSMPLGMKLKTEDEIIEIRDIQVQTAEKQFYAGILHWRYRCLAAAGNRQFSFTLLFRPDECTWKLLEPRE